MAQASADPAASAGPPGDGGAEAVRPRALSKAAVPPPRSVAPRRAALDGRFARLEPLDPAAHGDALFAEGCEGPGAEEIWTYMPYGPFADRAAFDGYLRGFAGSLDTVFFAICDRRADGRPVGVASFLDIEPAHGTIEIGHIWFGPSIRRGVVGSEALILMMFEAMDVFGARRLQWKCDALNARSRAAARRLGFGFEGVLHRLRRVKGRNRDTAFYAILDDEWPAARARLEAWLRPDNIGADGQARTGLSAMAAPTQTDRSIQQESGR